VASLDRRIAQDPDSVRERFERVRGRWREREIPTWAHQRHRRRLAKELERRGPEANGGVRIYLPVPGPAQLGGPDWVVPDAFAVSRANPARPGPGLYTGVPDLAVEVLADDNDDGVDLPKKAQYAAAGVCHSWLVRLEGMTPEASVLGAGGRYHQTSAGQPLPPEAPPIPQDLRSAPPASPTAPTPPTQGVLHRPRRSGAGGRPCGRRRGVPPVPGRRPRRRMRCASRRVPPPGLRAGAAPRRRGAAPAVPRRGALPAPARTAGTSGDREPAPSSTSAGPLGGAPPIAPQADCVTLKIEPSERSSWLEVAASHLNYLRRINGSRRGPGD
jgi:Uma2 family endonuclease